MPLKAFYGSRISENMTRTPEGFLICHNVPIARTGWYEYLGQELGLNDMYDQIVQVYRSKEEVFSPAAMASFEGKSVTDEHPHDQVRSDNYASYEKGQVTNVRPGVGEESDLLLADLIIKDPILISEIENGKREVSSGYDCRYEPLGDSKFEQSQIRGNHVAVVNSGRAGSRVAIKDNKPEKERSKPMNKNTLLGKMFASFAKDADTSPEELAQAAKDVLGGEPPEPSKETVTDEGGEAIAALAAKVDALTAIVTKLVESKETAEPQDELSKLEEELAKGSGSEESVTVPAEDIVDEAPVTPPEDRPENPIPGADKNAVLQAIRAIKPVIAAIPDVAERQKASDALAKTFRDQLKTSGEDQYGQIVNAVAANRKSTKDAKTDDTRLGKDWAEKFNPHYKKEAK